MGQDLLSGVLSLSIVLLNPSGAISAPSTSQITQTEEMRDYAVKEGDTLSTIAEKEYGSIDFWTNIWNDNDWIDQPDLIEKDWKLKIRNTKPLEAATLSAELSEKIQSSIQNNVTPLASVQTQTNKQDTYSYTGGPLSETQIAFLGNCESGMTASRNSGNGYFGAFQFSPATWRSMGTEYERADLAPLEVQIDAVQRLVAHSSIYTQFPGCARKMQSLGLL